MIKSSVLSIKRNIKTLKGIVDFIDIQELKTNGVKNPVGFATEFTYEHEESGKKATYKLIWNVEKYVTGSFSFPGQDGKDSNKFDYTLRRRDAEITLAFYLTYKEEIENKYPKLYSIAEGRLDKLSALAHKFTKYSEDQIYAEPSKRKSNKVDSTVKGKKKTTKRRTTQMFSCGYTVTVGDESKDFNSFNNALAFSINRQALITPNFSIKGIVEDCNTEIPFKVVNEIHNATTTNLEVVKLMSLNIKTLITIDSSKPLDGISTPNADVFVEDEFIEDDYTETIPVEKSVVVEPEVTESNVVVSDEVTVNTTSNVVVEDTVDEGSVMPTNDNFVMLDACGNPIVEENVTVDSEAVVVPSTSEVKVEDKVEVITPANAVEEEDEDDEEEDDEDDRTDVNSIDFNREYMG